MTSTVSDIDACTKRLEVAIPREEVAIEIDRAYLRLAGQVKLKGFRKGKVPRRVLERYYGEEVKAEVVNRVISTSYRELLEEKGMRPVGEPNVTDIAMEEDSPELTYKATVEVIPPFELGGYKGLELEIKSQSITDDLVEKQIGQYLKQRATFEDVDRTAKSGDYVLFDIEGFDGGEPVPDTRRENEAVLLGEAQNEKELEDALIGMKADEEKEIDIDVPESGPPNLAGKTLQFHVKVHSVKEANLPPLDEDFVGSLGIGLSSVEELRGHTRKNLEMQRENQVHQQGVTDLLRKLVEMHPFEVPPTLVHSEVESRIADYERQMRGENPEARISAAQREQIKGEITPQAEERVRQIILIERIREKEGILATPGEVDAQIQNLAAQYQMTPENLKKRMEMTGSVSQLITNINYNKTVDWVYRQSKVNVDIEEPESGSESGSDEPDGS
ncbi:MAG: trigger factor [bacterium]